ncbi:hypothetical protein EVAR_16368_1 [Eumeta japonica]|uniref:Histone-lysine N-methyltransferase SETMAR n=1 Tax=Eumeta variegata TaxID=151549 RepID=A0A4C1VV53_EUMVA|nr:hypothetical protein EVAR_16368_1 [Eumeta japonica]
MVTRNPRGVINALPASWVTDDLREGRSSTATTEDNINDVRLMIENYKRVTLPAIGTSLGIGISQVHKILHEYLTRAAGAGGGRLVPFFGEQLSAEVASGHLSREF